jgi:hypothetical protein
MGVLIGLCLSFTAQAQIYNGAAERGTDTRSDKFSNNTVHSFHHLPDGYSNEWLTTKLAHVGGSG